MMKPGFIENTPPFVTFITKNASKLVEDVANNTRLEERFGRTQDKFQTLMISGIGTFLVVDNDMDLVMKQWFVIVGRNNFYSFF